MLFNNDDTRVTFQVNMTEKMREGNFKPDSGDVVKVRGSFNGWNESLAMADPEVDGIYVLTTSVQGGTTINYKYFKTPRNGQDWENRSNRDYAVPSGTPSTIPVVYFDDDAGPAFAVAPAVLSFGNVSIGSGKTDSVQVTNGGTDSVQIATVVVSGAAEFVVVPGGPVAVPAVGLGVVPCDVHVDGCPW